MVTTQRVNPRKQPRQQRAQETVRAIMQATAHILIHEGYEKVTTNRLAELAGVSIGSLYQYFPSKEAVVAAVLDEHADQQIQLLAQSTVDLRDAPLEDSVRTYVHAQLEAHMMEPQLHRVLCEQLPRIRGFERIQEINAQATAMVRAFFELHRARIKPQNLELAAYVCVHAVESVTHAAVLEREKTIHVKELAEEMTQMVLRYLLDDQPARGASAQ